MGHLKLLHLGRNHLVVDGAVPAVEDEVLLGHLQAHVVAQMHVGDEEDVLLRQLAHHLDGVGGGHAHVAPALDLGGGVDVADHGEVVVARLDRVHVSLAHHVRHGAVGRGLGKQHRARGVEHLGALGHERHAAQHDGRAVERAGQTCQVERVAHVVGEGLRLAGNVVVREDDGVLLLLEARDLGVRYP